MLSSSRVPVQTGNHTGVELPLPYQASFLADGDCSGFLFSEPVLFIANALRKTDKGHGCLHLARAAHHTVGLNGDAHGSAGDGSKRVDAAGAVFLESGAREVGKSSHQLVYGLIRPAVQPPVVYELRVGCLDGGRLPEGAFHDRCVLFGR